eukprot:1232768-Pleurochrysis_carterae.AAC.2
MSAQIEDTAGTSLSARLPERLLGVDCPRDHSARANPLAAQLFHQRSAEAVDAWAGDGEDTRVRCVHVRRARHDAARARRTDVGKYTPEADAIRSWSTPSTRSTHFALRAVGDGETSSVSGGLRGCDGGNE